VWYNRQLCISDLEEEGNERAFSPCCQNPSSPLRKPKSSLLMVFKLLELVSNSCERVSRVLFVYHITTHC
jgi:hypothetical protein